MHATVHGLRVRRDTCFTDAKGREKPSLERAAGKLLAKAAPVLRPLVTADEEVLYVAQASSPYSVLELMTTGWIITYLKRCLLVVTDRRILHLPTDPGGRTKYSVATVAHGDVAEHKASSGLGGRLTLRYRNGKKEVFTGLRGGAVKKLRALLSPLQGRGEPSAAGGRHHLCPRCGAALAPASSTCHGCGLPFKDRSRAVRRSLLLPGGGYFYTGHPLLGILDAFVESLLILLVVIGFADAVLGGGAEAWASTAFLALLLVIEKAVTVYHAQHYVAEFLPAEVSGLVGSRAIGV